MNASTASQFQSNRCIAIHVADLDKAELFYGGALGFRLLNRTPDYLEFDTGVLLLYVNRPAGPTTLIPSLSVTNIASARQRLLDSGCTIIEDRGGSLYFRDPFGGVFNVVEE